MKIGDKLINFNLVNTNNEIISNYTFADRNALCIVFMSHSCKESNAYWGRLIKLAHRYEEDSIALVAINANDEAQDSKDSLEYMKEFMSEKTNTNLIYLKDEDQSVAKSFGAEKTPDVFLFNSKRELVYHGIIDDNWENESQVMMAYLEDAIEYCLDGIDIDYPEMLGDGTDIIWKNNS